MQFLFSLLIAALLLPASAFARGQDSWTAHFQSTCIGQGQPAFHSPCDGPHSLSGDAGASCWPTATASLGLRLGDGTEVCADPEAVHGVPLSGHGSLAALPSGELANMATWEHALPAAPVGTAPSLDPVRTGDHTKTGLGIDAEQPLASDLGAFVRAMKADGETETSAFTESDASLTAGLSSEGGRRPRDKDTVGLAFGLHAISSAQRDLLERGGVTSFLGNGALRDGHERMAELDYSAALGAGLSLTADVPRVFNPGEDVARGPASFHALCLHWES